MTSRTSWISVVAATLVAAVLSPGQAVAADRYLVVFRQEKLQADHIEKTVAGLGGRVVRDHSAIGVAIVESDEANFGRRLRQVADVVDARPAIKQVSDWSATGRQLMERSILAVSGPPPAATESGLAAATAGLESVRAADHNPDPKTLPFFPFQWNMRSMQVDRVWDMHFFGDPNVKVALLGAGIDYRHPDLDGKVDLDLSRSFVAEDDALVESLFPGAHPIADLAFHTTHVAGQITCTLTFLTCVAPDVTLVGVKILDFNEEGSIADLVSGIMYAADVADVIAIPFTYWGPGAPNGGRVWNWLDQDDRADILAVRRAIQYARRQGALPIAETSTPFFQFGISADTDGFDVILPAQAGALTIGASGRNEIWSNISNYGITLVDAVAPGGWADPNIPPNPVPFSPFREFIWGACSSFSQFGRLKTECAFENQPQFLVVLGAQGAVGEAAGVAALIESRWGGRVRQGLVQNLLLRTADDIEGEGIDPFTGRGRINAYRAVTE